MMSGLIAVDGTGGVKNAEIESFNNEGDLIMKEENFEPINKKEGELIMNEMNVVNDVEVELTNPMEETMKDVENKEITLKLTDIKRDKMFQVRVDLNDEAIKRYAGYYTDYKEATDRGKDAKCRLPPIWVFLANEQYILLCGYHRVEAALLAGLTTIQARVFQGSKADAYVFAARDKAFALKFYTLL